MASSSVLAQCVSSWQFTTLSNRFLLLAVHHVILIKIYLHSVDHKKSSIKCTLLPVTRIWHRVTICSCDVSTVGRGGNENDGIGD